MGFGEGLHIMAGELQLQACLARRLAGAEEAGSMWRQSLIAVQPFYVAS